MSVLRFFGSLHSSLKRSATDHQRMRISIATASWTARIELHSQLISVPQLERAASPRTFGGAFSFWIGFRLINPCPFIVFNGSGGSAITNERVAVSLGTDDGRWLLTHYLPKETSMHACSIRTFQMDVLHLIETLLHFECVRWRIGLRHRIPGKTRSRLLRHTGEWKYYVIPSSSVAEFSVTFHHESKLKPKRYVGRWSKFVQKIWLLRLRLFSYKISRFSQIEFLLRNFSFQTVCRTWAHINDKPGILIALNHAGTLSREFNPLSRASRTFRMSQHEFLIHSALRQRTTYTIWRKIRNAAKAILISI